jgi:hypothetical protein
METGEKTEPNTKVIRIKRQRNTKLNNQLMNDKNEWVQKQNEGNKNNIANKTGDTKC